LSIMWSLTILLSILATVNCQYYAPSWGYGGYGPPIVYGGYGSWGRHPGWWAYRPRPPAVHPIAHPGHHRLYRRSTPDYEPSTPPLLAPPSPSSAGSHPSPAFRPSAGSVGSTAATSMPSRRYSVEGRGRWTMPSSMMEALGPVPNRRFTIPSPLIQAPPHSNAPTWVVDHRDLADPRTRHTGEDFGHVAAERIVAPPAVAAGPDGRYAMEGIGGGAMESAGAADVFSHGPRFPSGPRGAKPMRYGPGGRVLVSGHLHPTRVVSYEPMNWRYEPVYDGPGPWRRGPGLRMKPYFRPSY